MTFLPIAQRELRVAARQRATHRWRMISGVAAAVVACGVGLIAYETRALVAGQAGVWIFNVLKWAAFILALLAGVFFTSDCLSEEKREGTLGLLFLTDLRGHDVAAGKLLATSLRPFYSLLAIFPIMALSFVLGGVPAAEFWKTLAAICNTLFFSLALGMAVSVVSRDANRAMTATGLVMTALLLIAPQLNWPPGFLRWRPELLSPAFAFMNAGAFRKWDFWASTATLNALGWGLLGMASWLAPRTWQDKKTRASVPGRGGFLRFLATSDAPKLRSEDPIAWIIARDRWSATIARLAVGVIAVLFAAGMMEGWRMGRTAGSAPGVMLTGGGTTNSSGMVTYTNSNGTVSYSFTASANSSSYVVATAGMQTWSFRAARACMSILAWLLELWLAVQVSRFYLEGRKSGFLELLLVTPTTPADVVRSHWRALRRMFLLPMTAQLALMLGMGALEIMVAPSGPAAFPAGLNMLVIVLNATTWTVGLFAIAWFAIWLGMTSKSLTTVILKIFCYLKVFPWMGVSFVFGISAVFLMRFLEGIAGAGTGTGLTRMNLVHFLLAAIPQGLILVVSLGLIALARDRTPAAFRDFTNAARA